MISFDDYKRGFGDKAATYTEAQLAQMYECAQAFTALAVKNWLAARAEKRRVERDTISETPCQQELPTQSHTHE